MKMDEFQTKTPVQFIREQDGPAERQLKLGLVEVLRRRDDVIRAYLAVGQTDSTVSVFLVLISSSGRAEPDLAQATGEVFSRMFNTREHLDIIFLNPAQENDIRVVAEPFFPAPEA